ncbi:hypothetical protein [Streptomyces sp. 3211]|uniref:hypothetical protein n=1 Tax=Streptomyces sp. 3211 TaxID=1964449 RepID=UPI0009A556E7|nr:hypothetical protein [Streptomyces sp. 3211]
MVKTTRPRSVVPSTHGLRTPSVAVTPSNSGLRRWTVVVRKYPDCCPPGEVAIRVYVASRFGSWPAAGDHC